VIIEAGKLNVTVPVYFVDDVSGTATGEPTTGLLFSDIETGGSASYQRQGLARVDFALVTVAVAGTHTDGGFIQIDATNMPGLYRLDVPDLAFATGVDFVIIQLVAAGGNDTLMRPIIVDLSPAANLVAIQGGAVPTPTTTGILDVNVERWLDTLVTLSAGAPDVNIQSTDNINLSTLQIADVNAQVVDVMSTDTQAEETQGLPPVAPTYKQMQMYLYMALRNDSEATATERRIKNDADVVIWKATMNDNGTVFNQGKAVTGP
jgi:hypothetical protein